LKSGIWNLEFGIWNLESGIWNLKFLSPNKINKKKQYFLKKVWRYKKRFYLCSAFRSKGKKIENGEVGEWLKPPVC
jgi:hypothetical protein